MSIPKGKIDIGESSQSSLVTLDTAYKGYKALKKKTKNPRFFSINIEHAREIKGLTMMISQNRILIGEGEK